MTTPTAINTYWITCTPVLQRMAVGSLCLIAMVRAGIISRQTTLYRSHHATEGTLVEDSIYQSYLPTGPFEFDITDDNQIFKFLLNYTVTSHREQFLEMRQDWKHTLKYVIGRDLPDVDRQTIQSRLWGPVETVDGNRRFVYRMELVDHKGRATRQFYREFILGKDFTMKVVMPTYHLAINETIREGDPLTGRFL